MADDVKGREHLVRRHQVMLAVFKAFSGVWRGNFAPTRWESIMPTWLDNLRGIDTDHLEPAAREFLRDPGTSFPPKPWEFAKYARTFVRTQQTSVLPAADNSAPSILNNARAFWFVRDGVDGPYYSYGWALASGGSVGISDREMDRLLAGEIRWGWGSPQLQAVS